MSAQEPKRERERERESARGRWGPARRSRAPRPRRPVFSHRSVIGALGAAAESLPMRARYMVKWALRTGEIRWHVSELFLWACVGVCFLLAGGEGGVSGGPERVERRGRCLGVQASVDALTT